MAEPTKYRYEQASPQTSLNIVFNVQKQLFFNRLKQVSPRFELEMRYITVYFAVLALHMPFLDITDQQTSVVGRRTLKICLVDPLEHLQKKKKKSQSPTDSEAL